MGGPRASQPHVVAPDTLSPSPDHQLSTARRAQGLSGQKQCRAFSGLHVWSRENYLFPYKTAMGSSKHFRRGGAREKWVPEGSLPRKAVMPEGPLSVEGREGDCP